MPQFDTFAVINICYVVLILSEATTDNSVSGVLIMAHVTLQRMSVCETEERNQNFQMIFEGTRFRCLQFNWLLCFAYEKEKQKIEDSSYF